MEKVIGENKSENFLLSKDVFGEGMLDCWFFNIRGLKFVSRILFFGNNVYSILKVKVWLLLLL